MAYGNLPGGGFSGFVKAKKPLPIERRSYIPIKDDDLYEELSDSKQLLLEPERKKRENSIDKQYLAKGKDDVTALKRKEIRKSRKKVSFDEKLEIFPGDHIADSKHTPKVIEESSKIFPAEKDDFSVKKILPEKDDEKQYVDFKSVKAERKAIARVSPESERSESDDSKFDRDETKQKIVPKSEHHHEKVSKIPPKKKGIRMRIATGDKYRKEYSKIITMERTSDAKEQREKVSSDQKYAIERRDKASSNQKDAKEHREKASEQKDAREQREKASSDQKDAKGFSEDTPKKETRKKKTTDEKFSKDEHFADDYKITSKNDRAELKKKIEKSDIGDEKYIEDASELVSQKKEKVKHRPKLKEKITDEKKRQIADEYVEDQKMEEEMAKTRNMKKSLDLKKPDEEIIFFPEENDRLLDDTSDEKQIYVKFKRIRKLPTYTYYRRKRSLLRFCPCIDRLLHSKRTEYRGLKAMAGFPIGALFGFALYWIVLERIGAEPYYFWLLGMIVGAGFAVSTQIRCICLLCIPTSCGRAGRAFISTYTVAYVIEGPFTNILTNAKEAMRSTSCTASLNLNHTVERFRLMFKPVKEIVLDFVGAGEKVQKDAKQLDKTYNEIENEVRDENEVREAMADVEELDKELGEESRVDIIKKKFKKKRKSAFGEDSEKKYGMKSELRCEEVFTKGVRACYDSFSNAYDRCHSYLPIIGYLLCWPMKLTFICDLASSLMGKRACSSDAVVNPGFGASVDTADAVEKELDKDFEVQLQYKLMIPEERVDQLVPEDISETMKYSFERRKKNLDFFTQLVDRVLALLCLLVLNSSRIYCNKYLRVIQFDNRYITSYFRHIDARRQKAGKMVLLPLKKLERLELFDSFSVRFSADEKLPLIIGGLRMVSEVLTVTILLSFDRIFYELLDIIKRNAHVTYKQTGVHHIKMTIYGDGFVGNMVRGILKGFDKKHSTDQVTTTEGCLPLPTKLPRYMITRLYLVFLLVLFLMILEKYALRLRRVICAFFYPKREKKRIIFLYNDRLKKRMSFLKHMRHRVRKQAREKAIAIDGGVFFTLRKFYPKYFNWLSKIGLGLPHCLICSETESKTCHLTDCPECPFSYCSECWQDTEGKCYACLPDYDTEPSDTGSDED